MEGLFSAVELQDAAAELAGQAGFRLERLEVLNWGTFDRKVWRFTLGGRNALLTGDIGSGKSTIVDAVTTLLVPSHRVSYNKAAGAAARERSLRSYVSGYYKAERDETTGSTRQVGLRTAPTFSVILGQFTNVAFETTVTLAQVFWLVPGQTGQPERFYVTAPRPMSIAEDFSHFGGSLSALRKSLRESGALVREHFPEYGRDFRRLLGIPSEQALDLFHQTVSMKSVGDLGEFVREHMLEPFDAERWTDRLVAHFDDLTRAHDAVVQARLQIERLVPLLADCESYDELGGQAAALVARRQALSAFAAARRIADLDGLIAALTERAAATETDRERVVEELSVLAAERQRLELERAGHGGDRLAAIDNEIARREMDRGAKRRRLGQFVDYLIAAGVVGAATAASTEAADAFADTLTDRVSFEEVRAAIPGVREELTDREAELDRQIAALAQAMRDVEKEVADAASEVSTLSAGTSNLPRTHIEIRDRLAEAVGASKDDLPFVGELLAVRPEFAEWEPAAERALRSFALALVVPAALYGEVCAWIDAEQLGMRLVYYRVPAGVPATTRVDRGDGLLLADMLDIRESAYAPWLESEIERRADYVCAATMEEFRRLPRAVTAAGQVKHSAEHHEKNDEVPIGDRRSYVLGWSTQAKLDSVLGHAEEVAARQAGLQAEYDAVSQERRAIAERLRALDRVDVYDEWDELDWLSQVRAIAALEEEKTSLESASDVLARIAADLGAVMENIARAEEERDRLVAALGADRHALDEAREQRERASVVLDDASDVDDEVATALAAEFDRELAAAGVTGGDTGSMAHRSAAGLDAAENAIRARLTAEAEDAQRRRSDLATKIAGQMASFRAAYPVLTAELDSDVRSADGYREIHTRLVRDDLPRFEADFHAYLNTNAIRDIAGFHAELAKQADLIRDRIDIINDSLRAIDYNPGRYIRLEIARTPNVEVREFQRDLRACTEGDLVENASGRQNARPGRGGKDPEGEAESDPTYSTERFERVRALVERFRGRDGLTDVDEAWRRRVTDVRNWFVLSASERNREDDSEHEHYSDSGGKSGGQKEKLAYTVLAASLAYQFKLDWGAVRSTAFRFVVIDEAFGRGSDESTRFALELFRRLGLQLLIVTPLQKIHVIEPYISSVGFVDNPTGRESRLRMVSIEEYRDGRDG